MKPAEAAFPARNGKIAFAGIRPSDTQTTNNWEIYTTYPHSFKLVNITNSPSIDVNPAWSPDGKKIAYERYLNGSSDIYVMNANGSRKKRLADGSGDAYSPAWSPDGTKIAFVSNRAGGIHIFIMDADGTNVTRLTNNARYNLTPSWSPDGTKIAYGSNPPGHSNVRDVYTINIDGSGETNLTNSTAAEGWPDWSPDGTKIAFYGNRNGFGIHVMNADGSDVKFVREGANPSWSPDGKSIAFEVDNPNEIAAINPDGSGLTFLTETPNLHLLGPDWQPRPPLGRP